MQEIKKLQLNYNKHKTIKTGLQLGLEIVKIKCNNILNEEYKEKCKYKCKNNKI